MDHRVGPPSWLPEGAAPEGTGPESEQATGTAQEQAGQAPSAFGHDDDVTVPARKPGDTGSNGTGRGEDITVADKSPAADDGYGTGQDGTFTYSYESPYGAAQGSSFPANEKAPDDSAYPPDDAGRTSGAGSVFTPDTSGAPEAGSVFTRDTDSAYTRDPDSGYTADSGSAYTRDAGGYPPDGARYAPDGARYTPDPAPPLPADPVTPTYGAGFPAEPAPIGDPAANAGPAVGGGAGGAAGPGMRRSAGMAGGATAGGAAAPGVRRVRAALGARRSSAYSATARARPAGTQARRANLVVARLEPWSVMKFSFLISLVCWLVLFVAVAILYYILSGLGVFDALQRTLGSVTSSQGSSGVNLSRWTSAPRVLGYTMLIGAANVVLITALSTVGAMIYNLVTHLGGGIEITLKESD